MEVAAALGEGFLTTLLFSVTPADVDLFFGRSSDPPRGLNNYFENFKNWSEQLPRKGGEKGKTLPENPTNKYPVVGGDRIEDREGVQGC